jgi:hypothetical protein
MVSDFQREAVQMKHIAAVALMALAGCAGMQPGIRAGGTQVACTSKDDCDAKWGRAVQWIGANSHWRIRLMNDTLLETFDSSDTFPAYRLTRIPDGKGGGTIQVEAGCGNVVFGCQPDQSAPVKATELAQAMMFPR